MQKRDSNKSKRRRTASMTTTIPVLCVRAIAPDNNNLLNSKFSVEAALALVGRLGVIV